MSLLNHSRRGYVMYKVAVDIGGTFMRAALFRNNELVKMVKEQTPNIKTAFIKQLISIFLEM